MYMYVCICIEQQITHSHMKTIQKSRNHNFRMRRLTNYRFLHTIRYDTIQLKSLTCITYYAATMQ